MIFKASTLQADPIAVRTAATVYPERMPMINGISFTVFFPYVEHIIVTNSVTNPQSNAIHVEPIICVPAFSTISGVPLVNDTEYSVISRTTSPLTISDIALPARDSPMIATVGPITTVGISLLSQLTPAIFTAMPRITYTSPASAAPIIKPSQPSDMDTPPAKAASMDLIKAKEEPTKTGLFRFVSKI